MDKQYKEELKQFYNRLVKIKDTDIILNAYSEDLEAEDGAVLSDIFDFLYENDIEPKTDWQMAFIQLYFWEFQSFHEGADTYYKNSYGNSDYNTILKTAQYLKSCGYEDIYQVYISGIDSYQEPRKLQAGEIDIDDWIDNHTEEIYDCMLTLLIENIKEMLEKS